MFYVAVLQQNVNIAGVFLSTNVLNINKIGYNLSYVLIFLVRIIIFFFQVKGDSAKSMEINLESEINDGTVSA